MLEVIELNLTILVILMILFVAGNPEGYWVSGRMGRQIFLVIIVMFGIMGILETLGGVEILGGTTMLSLLVMPFLACGLNRVKLSKKISSSRLSSGLANKIS